MAEVVNHNVECGEEGVHIDHEELVPFPKGSGSRPTLECGCLPLKFRADNSHQAFKGQRGLTGGKRSTNGFYTHRAQADRASISRPGV